ncbi:CDP-alcohol phosphatidyltransferase family protein [Marinicauda algicola]|uniref:CDP-diacylglycerol--glycerol-3-phosphate 3-phosphatidyltransferase n=1 Tax=Marinicauda algicola TaxID=2029849 RepID=A0A4S2H3X9_9PROT|nr:CDP-alcohol phosphatidyltransferase family protein [Marinicauda algicola]TGY90081.1 CDP-alcohol phosphatidyltransferase family protein [Marinicauda algicola]
MRASHPPGLTRHLPNLVTIGRALAGLAGAWMLLHARHLHLEAGTQEAAVWFAAGSGLVFAIAALSDGLDGWLARALGATSPLGALLDPIADKVLVAAYLLAFVRVSGLDPYLTPAVAIIVGRDVVVTGLRLSRLSRDEVPLPVTDDAKFKTGLVMILIALPYLLVLFGMREVAAWFYLWVGGVWLAAALSAWTAVPYLRKALSR